MAESLTIKQSFFAGLRGARKSESVFWKGREAIRTKFCHDRAKSSMHPKYKIDIVKISYSVSKRERLKVESHSAIKTKNRTIWPPPRKKIRGAWGRCPREMFKYIHYHRSCDIHLMGIMGGRGGLVITRSGKKKCSSTYYKILRPSDTPMSGGVWSRRKNSGPR